MVNDEVGRTTTTHTSSSSIPIPNQNTVNDFSNHRSQNDVLVLSTSAASGTGAATPLQRRRYDVSATMDRLRTSFAGPVEENEYSSSISMEERKLESTGCDDDNNNDDYESMTNDFRTNEEIQYKAFTASSSKSTKINQVGDQIGIILHQIPAIILIGMFHLMIGIPFGVSYFPIGWSSIPSSQSTTECQEDCDMGKFPLPGKEALGIRMFLFATMIGQIVFTMFSGFVNPIGLQMVENVPFCHALSHIVIQHQGYGIQSLSTLFVMFGLSSIIVGAVFYLLGKFQLGRIVYYFPTHVLVGCIGGIGVFLFKTAIEVTINEVFGWNSIVKHANLLLPVILFECTLRFLERITLDADGKPLFSLLSPVFFIMITPVFYTALWILGINVDDANEAGYFFPSLLEDCDSSEHCASSSMWDTIFNKDLFDTWRVIDISVVSWSAVVDSIPTLIALTLFSLIHVPINIPAFALSTNVEADMNRELVAHGYSNFIAGLFGGLQNYMAYTQSVLYHKASGRGKVSGFAVAILTACLFFVGPTIASYIPKCMAGALLVHVGIDLFLEGVYDSFGKFDRLEYSGIWLIVIVMTLKGMDAAMVAGVIAAVSTYAVQSITYINPIRGVMSASTLRSSRQNITNEARSALEDERIGRNRILVIQLQGHLFFGNMAHLTESINKILCERQKSNASAWIVILDFSLVLSIDSSAAQTMTKLRRVLRQSYNVDLCIFVSGSEEGFPCQMDLSKELNTLDCCSPLDKQAANTTPNEESALLERTSATSSSDFCGSRVEESLDDALVFAEDALLARQGILPNVVKKTTTPFSERNMALEFLTNLCPSNVDPVDVMRFLNNCSREVFQKNDLIWSQGSPSDSVKLLVQGTLISLLENEAGTREVVCSGNTVGELGLLQGLNRMSSVYCLSDEAVLYSLSRESFEELSKTSPNVVRLLDLICIRYLSARVQHVSNRIFETRCLPI